MSKSKGNVINPLTLVDKYGADALRMALVMSTTPGHDSAVGENKVRGMRNFSNKIWNAARFIRINRELSITNDQKSNNTQLSTLNDQTFEKHLEQVVRQVTEHLDNLRMGQAAETVHNEFWHWYCDEVIESYKGQETSYEQLETGLKTFLKLLHPFMPFVTEAIWQDLNSEPKTLMEETWPSLGSE
jgi:valyl-tRNA synthetase